MAGVTDNLTKGECMEPFSVEINLSSGAESVDLDQETSLTTFRPSAEEDLCDAIVRQYQAALTHTQTLECGGGSGGKKTLEVVLEECYEQLHGIRTTKMEEMEERFGVSYLTNFTALKVSTVCNWLQEALQDSDGLPVTLTPSPIPSLNATALQDIAQNVVMPKMTEMMALEQNLANFAAGVGLANSTTIDSIQADTLKKAVMDAAIDAKALALEASIKMAEDAAKKHEKLIKDQMFDGGYNEAMINFLHDMALYPFACMSGPKVVMVNTPVWKKGKFVDKEEAVVEFKAISPFDVCWSEDCTDGQNGTAVYYKHRMGYNDLKRAGTLESYNEKNIKKLLKDWREGEISPNWAGFADESPRTGEGTADELSAVLDSEKFKVGSTIEVVTRYGLMMGEDMKTLGVKDAHKLDDDVMYETTISFVKEHVIQAFISDNIGSRKRPIHFASYEAMKDRIPGVSVAMKIRDLEMAYNAAQRIMLYNVSASSAPLSWVDISRLHEDIASHIETYMALDPQTPLIMNNNNAFTNQQGAPVGFVVAPNNTPVIQNLMQYLTQMIDVISGVPESLHGQPVGTGANRTVSGMFNLQANATKAIQQALNNIDRCVVGPIGQMLYYYNMEYSDDQSIKGDAKVSSVYGKNMLQNEIKKQKSMEAFQLATQAAGAMQNDPEFMGLFKEIFVDLFTGLGYPLGKDSKGLSQGAQPPMAPAVPTQGGEQTPQQPTPPLV